MFAARWATCVLSSLAGRVLPTTAGRERPRTAKRQSRRRAQTTFAQEVPTLGLRQYHKARGRRSGGPDVSPDDRTSPRTPRRAMREDDRFQDTTLSDYVAVLRRRKSLFLTVAILVPVVAVLASLVQTRIYSASAQVLLGGERLAEVVNGLPESGLSVDADRVAQTQVDIARVEQVASRTLRATGFRNLTVTDFLVQSRVAAKSNADILVFTVDDPSRGRAVRLANEYARQFTIYRAQLDSVPVRRALRVIQSRISEIERGRNTQLLRSLRAKERQLETLASVQFSNTRVLRVATNATQVRPRLALNLLIGIIFGVLLGAAAAFVRDATDTRVRSAKDVVDALDLPVLGLVPELAMTSDRAERLVMLREPESSEAEAFRMLRTKLDLANLTHQAQVVMFTSGAEDDGKSTVVSNLAVALARGGRRVILVDFDLRRPSLLHLFGLRSPRGLTTVALEAGTMDEALLHVNLGDGDAVERTRASIRDLDWAANPPFSSHRSIHQATGGTGSSLDALADHHGELLLLPAGPVPANVGEFVENSAVRTIFDDLRARSEFILVDAPPLYVSDAVALSTVVDAVVVVASVRVAQRRALSELVQTLATLPATKLGLVITDVGKDEHTYGAYGTYQARPSELDIEGSPRQLHPTSSVSASGVADDEAVSSRWQHEA